MNTRIAVAILFAGLLGAPSQVARQPATGTSGEPQYCGDCWTLLGQPFYYTGAETYEVDVTYYSGFDTNITGTANLVIRNDLGQTVGVDMTTTTIPPGQNRTLHPSVREPLPPGTYSTSVFATNDDGVVISNVTTGSFQQKYFVLFQGFSSESDSTSVGVVLTNVSPATVQGTLRGYLNDTLGDVLSTVSQNVTVAANSQTTTNLDFPSTGDINLCFLHYTFIVVAPNGTALSPWDHEGTPAICQDYFHFPMTPPVEVAVGAFQTLETTVTNFAPFSVTLVFYGQVQNSNDSEIAIPTSTITLAAGQVSTDYLAVPGLRCGSYTVHISVRLVTPSSLPPDMPQFSSGFYDAPFSVC